ncbi:MAG: phosphoglycolate phosphatase [Gammaproteobacteria bacterium]|nr:phosphoglycolate phosphatase [Gammaproteobacteria bacterium]
MKTIGRNPFKLIAFDLDGTLVDSAPDIAQAVNGMLAELGLPPRSVEQVRHYLGNGVDWLAKRALTGQLWHEPEPKLFQEALSKLLIHYAQNNGQRTVIYPGVIEALEYARGRGIALACITNKKGEFTQPLLEFLDLRHYFDLVISGDDFVERKPDPAPLLYAMQQLGALPEETLMVGDSVTDVKTGRAAGAAVAAVTYGYNHGDNIADAKPDWVIDSLAEIRTILQPGNGECKPD